MKIERLELLLLKMPLVHPFETSFGRVTEKETVIIRAESGGVSGYGEAPAAMYPGYSYETTETVWHIIKDFIAPKLKGIEILRPGPISEFFTSIRGHSMAKAGVEMAILDLLAKCDNKPLHQILGGTQKEIPAGVSLGIEERIENLVERVSQACSAGYQRIKVKIKPRWDIDVIAAIRKQFPAIPLMVDANAAYTLDDLAHLKKLDDFNLMMIEQPLDEGDLIDHAKLQKELKTPICLDESIKNYSDGRRAIEIGACKIINIKPARVGGPFMAKALHNICVSKNIPIWCGGLLETGIGRAHNIAVASLPGFTLPGDISASERYFKEDVIDPPVKVSPKGTISVPQGPGIGFMVIEERLNRRAARREKVL